MCHDLCQSFKHNLVILSEVEGLTSNSACKIDNLCRATNVSFDFAQDDKLYVYKTKNRSIKLRFSYWNLEFLYWNLINPMHFKSWRNANTIILTQIELPVSRNYKDVLLAL